MTKNKIITPQNEIDSYYNNTEKVSQSELKHFLTVEKFVKYIDKFNNGQKISEDELYYAEKEHFIIGTGVDILVTQNEEVYNNHFYVSTLELPSEKIISICHLIFDTIRKENLEILPDLSLYSNEILLALDFHSYQTNWKTETRVQKIIQEGDPYFSQLVAAKGRIIIDENTDMRIKEIASNILDVAFPIFEQMTLLNSISLENVIHYNQFPLYTKEFKGLVDRLIIDEESRKIYVLDFKTSMKPLDMFIGEIKKFRLDIQLSFYKHLIEQGALIEILKFPINAYKIECTLIVNSVNIPQNFKIIRLSDEVLDTAKDGKTEVVNVLYDFHVTDDKIDIVANTQTQLPAFGSHRKITGFLELINLHKHFKISVAQNKNITELMSDYVNEKQEQVCVAHLKDIFYNN